MNCLWVTDRRAPGGDRMDEILDALRGADHLWVEIRALTSSTPFITAATVAVARTRSGPPFSIAARASWTIAGWAVPRRT